MAELLVGSHEAMTLNKDARAWRTKRGKAKHYGPGVIGEGLLTTTEVAHLLYAHNNTVRRWANKGLLSSYRIGPRCDRRFRRDDIVRFLIQHYERENIEKGPTNV